MDISNRHFDEIEQPEDLRRMIEQASSEGPIRADELGISNAHTPGQQHAGIRKLTKAQKKATKRGRRS